MKRDTYLDHAFEAAFDQREAEAAESEGRDLQPVRLPMLLLVRPERFRADNITDFSVSSIMGNIVAGIGGVDALDQLEADPDVIAIEASRPGILPETAQSLPFARADLAHQAPLSEDGAEAIVAVIDTGLDPLHEALRDRQGRSRIEFLWDQTDPPTVGKPVGLAYGTVYDRAQIDAMIAQGTVPPGLGRDPDQHGTHVTSIAAGQPVSGFSGGVAPAARIIFVRATLAGGGNSTPVSLGYSNSHVDALTFIRQKADLLELPVVVNVSLGMNAGAHDGTSLLEAAFDQFSGGGRDPGRIIVKSAGNEAGQNGHARVFLGQNNAVTIPWRASLPHRGPDNLELWFKPADQLQFRLHAPGGQTTPWVDRGNPRQAGRIGSYGFRLSLDRYCNDNGDSRLLVTLAGTALYRIPSGLFELEIVSGHVPSGGQVDAWIERDLLRLLEFTNHTNNDMTLSIPGTARSVIAVANIESRFPMKVAQNSSIGPTRDKRDKPDISAPGQNVHAALSGSVNGTHAMSGTSMAAPHVSGAVALLLSRLRKRALQQNEPKPNQQLPNAVQTAAALRNTAQNFNGQFKPDQGFGALDVEQLLHAFD